MSETPPKPVHSPPVHTASNPAMEDDMSVQDREELALKLLASLPRSRLAILQQQIAPLLQFDIVGTLPTEVALQVFTHLPYQTLLVCSLISKQWQKLANDQSLWKKLCDARGWAWRQPPRFQQANATRDSYDQSDDEGIGESDEEYEDVYVESVEEAKVELTMMHAELDSGLMQLSMTSSSVAGAASKWSARYKNRTRHSAPSAVPNKNALVEPPGRRRPDYKLLHQTHIRLRNRFLTPSYRLSPLQTKGSLNSGGHTSTIYCLQLYTDPETGKQVLFTGSRDRTVREWNLTTRMVERVIDGIHASSVLSICVHNGYLASAGSDRRLALWDLKANRLVKALIEHEDSVLCVRFNDQYLVSCSKDKTVRVYSFPSLELLHILDEHRAAVNTVSLSGSYIFTGSGDRSIRLWDAKSGKVLRTFDNHHTRGIAAIDFKPPIVISGSSDRHIRLLDVTTLQGWSTNSEYTTTNITANSPLPPFPPGTSSFEAIDPLCPSCGSSVPLSANPICTAGVSGAAAIRNGAIGIGVGGDRIHTPSGRCRHRDLVRTVALGDDFVISGSYDLTIKIWDRKTGAMVADLTGGHTGRIFCIAADCTKIVSCGEDHTICIWDFSHGIDTSFLQLSSA